MECRNLTGATAKPLAPWQKRVTEEQIQLNHRLEDLEAFIGGSDFSRLPEVEQGLLTRQLDIMRDYFQVLYERITLFIA